MIRLRLWVFGNDTTEVKYLFHDIISGGYVIPTWHPCDVKLDHLAKVVFARFLHLKVTGFFLWM